MLRVGGVAKFMVRNIDASLRIPISVAYRVVDNAIQACVTVGGLESL